MDHRKVREGILRRPLRVVLLRVGLAGLAVLAVFGLVHVVELAVLRAVDDGTFRVRHDGKHRRAF